VMISFSRVRPSLAAVPLEAEPAEDSYSLFRKLGVSTRSQAVARPRELSLLDE
jgi:hypothetical protein